MNVSVEVGVTTLSNCQKLMFVAVLFVEKDEFEFGFSENEVGNQVEKPMQEFNTCEIKW